MTLQTEELTITLYKQFQLQKEIETFGQWLDYYYQQTLDIDEYYDIYFSYPQNNIEW